MDAHTRLGSEAWSDEAFVDAMERITLPESCFTHADHIRLAWLFLRTQAMPEAAERMARTLQRYSTGMGKAERFHVTLTRLWMLLVDHHVAVHGQAVLFAEFASANPGLFDKALPFAFYSRTRLYGNEARAGWVEPDLAPLPRAGSTP